MSDMLQLVGLRLVTHPVIHRKPQLVGFPRGSDKLKHIAHFLLERAIVGLGFYPAVVPWPRLRVLWRQLAVKANYDS